MNKYYTPTIEEIISHIISERFIYMNYHPQQDVIPGIESTNLGQLYFSDDIVDSLNSFIKMNDCKTSTKDGSKVYSINPELYKIKYLDKDDIKDLNMHITAEYGNYIEFSRNSIKYLYNIEHKTLHIENCISPNTAMVLFYGVIKNKSELKKLLTQLQINA